MEMDSDRQMCSGWDNSQCRGTPYCPSRCPRYIDNTGLAIEILPYHDEDLGSLVTMYDELEWEDRTMGLPPVTRPDIHTWIQTLAADGWNLVAHADNRIVGHVGIAPVESHEPQFVIFVHHDYHNRGIGSEMVRQVIAYAADRGYDAIELSAASDNKRSIHVYENIGFEQATQQLSTESTSHIDMRFSFPHPIADYVRLPPAEQ